MYWYVIITKWYNNNNNELYNCKYKYVEIAVWKCGNVIKTMGKYVVETANVNMLKWLLM